MRIKTNSKTNLSDILIYSLVAVVLITFIYIDKAEANYNNEFCNSNKCKARIERLKECNWNIECTVNKTLEAMEKDLYKNISNLKKKSLEAPKVGLNEAVQFVAKFEGFRSESYFDWYANWSNRWSIWYGTKSYKGEIITKEVATARKLAIVEPLYISIPPCFTQNQKIAITSYIYNTGWNQMGLKNYIGKCKKKDVLYIMKVWGHNPVLKPRRDEELLKFNEK